MCITSRSNPDEYKKIFFGKFSDSWLICHGFPYLQKFNWKAGKERDSSLKNQHNKAGDCFFIEMWNFNISFLLVLCIKAGDVYKAEQRGISWDIQNRSNAFLIQMWILHSAHRMLNTNNTSIIYYQITVVCASHRDRIRMSAKKFLGKFSDSWLICHCFSLLQTFNYWQCIKSWKGERLIT